MDPATLALIASGVAAVILLVAFGRGLLRGLGGTKPARNTSKSSIDSQRNAISESQERSQSINSNDRTNTRSPSLFAQLGSWTTRSLLVIVSILMFVSATKMLLLELPGELGHALAQREYGRIVGTLLFQPLPFMAATWAWVLSRRIGARMRAPHFHTSLRPDVLYLRAFEDDERAAGTRWKGPLLPWPSEEEQLVSVLSDLGGVLAIGKPGESLPNLGATRVQVSDAEWQSAVQRFATDARAVVYRVPVIVSPGVEWEIEELLSQDLLSKLILLLPNSNTAVRNFNSLVGRRFDLKLPSITATNLIFRPSVSALIWWVGKRPQYVAVQRPSWLRRRLLARIEPSLRQALHEWSRGASIQIKPPRIRAHRLVLLVGFAAIAVAVILSIAAKLVA